MIRRAFRRTFGPDARPPRVAWTCVIAALGLCALGTYTIDVGTNIAAAEPFESESAPVLSAQAIRHLVFLAAGIAAALAACVPHYRTVRLVAWPVLAVMAALLVFLLLPFVPAWIVTPRNGCRGWINLGPIDFQPSEIAKIAYVLVLSDYLRHKRNHRTFLGLAPPAVIAFVPIALILLQPDLGTASLFIPSLFAILAAAGAKLKHLTIVVLAACLAGPAAYPLLKPHQKARIVGLVHQVRGDPTGADDINFQARTASTIAGAGGLTGYPDEKSRAVVRFSRLPERHNDMVFSVVLNRFGFLGGLAVLALYLLWLAGAFLTAARCKDPFARLVCVGLAAFVAAQMFINVGMNVGVLPIIGLTLPFVSYGGSSMLASWIMTGLIVSIDMRPPPKLYRPSFEFGQDD